MHEHVWKEFMLKYKPHDCGPRGEVYFTGHFCGCGEYGYEVTYGQDA